MTPPMIDEQLQQAEKKASEIIEADSGGWYVDPYGLLLARAVLHLRERAEGSANLADANWTSYVEAHKELVATRSRLAEVEALLPTITELAGLRAVNFGDGPYGRAAEQYADRIVDALPCPTPAEIALGEADPRRAHRQELREKIATLRWELEQAEGRLRDANGEGNALYAERNTAVRERDSARDQLLEAKMEIVAVARQRDEAYEVLAAVVDQWDDGAGDLEVEHTMIDREGHISGYWSEPACGDDNDACSRETCPAIWVINDAARIVHDAERAGIWRKS